jgi:hypothetical protein
VGDCNPAVLAVGGDVTPASGQEEKLVAAIEAGAAGSFMPAELARAGVGTSAARMRRQP